MNKKPDYMQLLTHLIRDFVWPTDYMFKFIVPLNPKNLNQITELFDKDAKISTIESKNGKYISVTAVQLMDNPDDVIEIYQKAEIIENIISL